MPAAGGTRLSRHDGGGGARAVQPVAVAGADGRTLLDPLLDALSGTGPAVAPHPADQAPDDWARTALADDEDDPTDPTVAVVATTGSTGLARAVLLQASALRTSATATAERLGGPGSWLLAVPAHTVAGLMVCVRSLLAGTSPAVLDLRDGFSAGGFAAAGRELLERSQGIRCTSLVPTQLRRLLDEPGASGAAARSVLAGFDAVLVGGAALDPATRDRAASAGARVVETYGMTETCGGCVYDGEPLPGVQVALEPAPGTAHEGRVVLAGPVLARGYRRGHRDGTGAGGGFDGPDGDHVPRRFRTSDRGRLVDGRLQVLGRLDDVVVCGGVNVSLDAVARAARTVDGVGDAVAVGVPDARWGSVVGVVVAGSTAAGARDRLTRAVVEAVRRDAGRAATPHHVVVVDRLPLAGVGKPDRTAALRLVREHPLPPVRGPGRRTGPG